MQSARRKKQLVVKTITVPGNLLAGCDEFNSALFFECHERFEEIWQLESGPVRDLYKGLIQVAAAFVHLQRGKFIGGERLLRTALAYLAPYRETGAMGFDVEAVCRATEDMYERLLAVGPGGVSSLDLMRRPYYTFDAAKLPAEARRWNAWGFDGEGRPLEMTITVAE